MSIPFIALTGGHAWCFVFLDHLLPSYCMCVVCRVLLHECSVVTNGLFLTDLKRRKVESVTNIKVST